MLPYLMISGIAYLGGTVSALGRRMSFFGLAALSLFSLVLCFFIGFRFEVGKDWLQYLYIFEEIANMSLGEAMGFTDSAYALLNGMANQMGLGVSAVFFVCALILVAGIVSFSAQTPYPWIGVAVAMPHIVTVMAMDHVRQATALGFVLIGLSLLARERVWVFLACILLGALFHRTAIIIFPFGLLLVSKNRALLYPAFLATAAVMVQYMLSERLDLYSLRYLETEAGSRGALVRLLHNALPAVGFLLVRNRLDLNPKFNKIMTSMAYMAILTLLIMPMSPSAVVIDRIGKYFLPVQILFFPAVVALFRGSLIRASVTMLIVLYLLIPQVYWLSKSDLARDFWIPYKSVEI